MCTMYMYIGDLVTAVENKEMATCTMYMYIGDLVTAVENKEMATESGNRIQAGQAGNDHC